MMFKSLLATCALLGSASAVVLPSTTSSSAIPTSTKSSLPDIEAIKSVPQTSFKSYQTGELRRQNVSTDATEAGSLAKRAWKCSAQPTFTWGDVDNGGLGVTIANDADDWAGYYIYHNSCDSVPYKYVWVESKNTVFISLPAGFEGRIQRGLDDYMLNGQPQLLGTWFEFSFDENNWIWGDVSLIRGCDGAVLMWSLDNSGAWKGFTQWILDGAPTGAYDMKNDGQWVIKATEGKNAVINTIPRDWDIQKVGAEYVYVDDSHGSPTIASTNGRFGTFWPGGRP